MSINTLDKLIACADAAGEHTISVRCVNVHNDLHTMIATLEEIEWVWAENNDNHDIDKETWSPSVAPEKSVWRVLQHNDIDYLFQYKQNCSDIFIHKRQHRGQ